MDSFSVRKLKKKKLKIISTHFVINFSSSSILIKSNRNGNNGSEYGTQPVKENKLEIKANSIDSRLYCIYYSQVSDNTEQMNNQRLLRCYHI